MNAPVVWKLPNALQTPQIMPGIAYLTALMNILKPLKIAIFDIFIKICIFGPTSPQNRSEAIQNAIFVGVSGVKMNFLVVWKVPNALQTPQSMTKTAYLAAMMDILKTLKIEIFDNFYQILNFVHASPPNRSEAIQNPIFVGTQGSN